MQRLAEKVGHRGTSCSYVHKYHRYVLISFCS